MPAQICKICNKPQGYIIKNNVAINCLCYFPQGKLYPDKVRDAMLERLYPTAKRVFKKKELILVDGGGI